MKATGKLIGIAALAMLLLAAMGINAQTMYRWVDANGNVVYSDQPPPPDAREARALKGPKATTSDDDDTDVDTAYEDQEEEFQRRRAKAAEDQTKAEQEAALAEERKRNCEMARSNLQTLTAETRITRRNAQGETVYLSDEQIARERAQAQKSVEEWCGSR